MVKKQRLEVYILSDVMAKLEAIIPYYKAPTRTSMVEAMISDYYELMNQQIADTVSKSNIVSAPIADTVSPNTVLKSDTVLPKVRDFPLRPGTHLNSDKLPPPTEWCDVHQEAKMFDPDFGIQICQKCTA